MAEIYKKGKAFNGMIAHMGGVKGALRDEAGRLEGIAQTRLTAARSSTKWVKYDRDSAGETAIEVSEADGQYTCDYHVSMTAENAMAIEYGHAPSGKLEGTRTRAPFGLYIMTGTHSQA
jgi:hypothetical protein